MRRKVKKVAMLEGEGEMVDIACCRVWRNKAQGSRPAGKGASEAKVKERRMGMLRGARSSQDMRRE